MNKIKIVRPETLEFIALYYQLKGKAFKTNSELAGLLHFNSPASITEIVKHRQNIDPDKFLRFKELYSEFQEPTIDEHPKESFKGIPMYNLATDQDRDDASPVGWMNFPGIEECDFALPVWGQSMYPCLEHGCWVALKIIPDGHILPGEVYYVEWNDYRMYKRLLPGETSDQVIAHSDNVQDKIGGQLQYPPIIILKADIRRLGLVKHIHKKHHH